ncbi:ABC transporter substrate-binding protein [Inquilinus limosus]|uniref:MlaC/ttg2D family ABC transporter substrate-binding protein n=1 Tax=Inquilinus limosus TaxID=171674 RepID=UPI003F14590F
MIDRRTVLTAGAMATASLLLAGLPRPAAAQADGAAAFIDGMAKRAIGILQAGGASTAQGKAEFTQILNQGFDLPTIGRFVLGRYWNSATPEQRQEYMDLFERMIVETYSRRFQNYQGETLVVKGTRAVGSGNDTLVATEIRQKDGPPIQVDWRVRQAGGGYKVVDVIVARVSMSVTQRDEFASVIAQNGGSIDGLLRAMRQRAGG